MALIVEDGNIIPNANSYSTLAALRAYAADRGVVLPAVDADLIPLAIKAADYIESFADRFVGSAVSVNQSLSWPRKNVQQIDGSDFPSNAIPIGIMSAQAQLCIEQFNGIVLLPTIDASNKGQVITKEKIDVLETDYSDKYGTVTAPLMPAVDALLDKYLNNSGLSLRAIRV